jgi:SAM-dependent methyltransferase
MNRGGEARAAQSDAADQCVEPGELAVRFLKQYLAVAPQYPNQALLRCWEAALFSSLRWRSPLLDLGCGDGRIMESLLAGMERRARPERVFGLDIDPGSVHHAAARESYVGAVVADARHMPVAPGALASSVSVCVLEHIEGVEPVLAEVNRVLQPGGVFGFSVPTPCLLEIAGQTHPRDPQGYTQAFNERVEHRTVWDLDTWRAALERNGLRVRTVHGFMPPAAAATWFEAYDWVVRPIRGRGVLYRMAGPGLRRLGVGRALGAYWLRRLEPWARRGVSSDLGDAGALLIVAEKPACAGRLQGAP